ncbi:MAG: ATP-NAD kinase family protein [Methanomicrobiales archaeon]|nr:ATP-NAD kinase family protein [Methanomicrobiales archaeon]
MKRIGLIVNPVAGMGGSVGLKGTDGNVEEARRRGAVPHAGDRAKAALEQLAKIKDLIFFTCSGAMGEDVLSKSGIKGFEVVYHVTGESSSADTKEAVGMFLKTGVDLVLFCGGDGTARDVFDVIGRETPLMGIPAGVKMYSAVFAVDPASVGDLVQAFTRGHFRDAEVMDVDEEAYRRGELRTHLYGIARTPALAGKIQAAKEIYEEADEERAKAAIAQFIDEILLPDVLYIIGAGTTTEALTRRIGIKKTLLGVDAIRNRRMVAADCDERTLLSLADKYKETRIILSLIGAQGFILGRGNQQMSADLVRKVGIKNIIVIATPHKLAELPFLYVDSGDPDLDREFGDSIQVISGYRIAQRKKIRH